MGSSSGNSIADFLLGLAYDNSTFLYGGKGYTYQNQYHLYAQDQWHVTRRLTLSYGLRYELHSPWTDLGGWSGNFDYQTGALTVTAHAPSVTTLQQYLKVPIERLSTNSFYPTTACCLGPLMPRFGFSWQVPGMNSAVLRGGYGISLDTENGNIINGMFAAPFWVRTGDVDNVYPGIGFNANRATLSNITSIVTNPTQTNFRDGYIQSWNLTAEKQFQDGMFFSLAYVGSKGTHMGAVGYPNTPPLGAGLEQPREHWPAYNNFYDYEDYGESRYNSLQVRAERHFQSGLGYLMTYTYGLSLGNADSINADRLPLEDPRSGWGRNTFDIRQRFTSAVMYELPFGDGKRFLRSSSRAVNGLVGGWQANMIYNAQTPYPISIQVSPCLQNGGSLRTCPPNLIGPDHGALPKGQRSLTRWFNPAAFSAPAAYTLGNMQTWSLSGPYGLNNWDTSMIKNTRIRERMTLQFRAEFFNFFNHPQFNGVNTTLGSASFGHITSATDERNIQFALKLLF